MATFHDQYIKPIIETPNPMANNPNAETQLISIYLKLPDGSFYQIKSSDGNTPIYYSKYCDYIGSYMDVVRVKFRIEYKKYLELILPNVNNLECYITGAGIDDTLYKMRVNNSASNIEGTNSMITHRTDFEGSIGYLDVEGECYTREAEIIRTQFVDGICNNTDLRSVLMTQLKNVASKCAVEGKPVDITLDVAKLDNNDVYSNVVIPSGTSVLGLPRLLQNGDYGLYNGGANAYITHTDGKPTIYVYPLYTGDRFDDAERKLILYRGTMPQYNYQQNTYRTYSVSGGGGKQDIVEILVTSNSSYRDNAEYNYHDGGGNFIVNSADFLSGEAGKHIGNKRQIYTGNRMTKFHILGQPEDTSPVTTYVGQDANVCKVASLGASSLRSTLTLEWRFANPNLLTPGMPVMYVYERNGVATALTGSLHTAIYGYNFAAGTMSASITVALDKGPTITAGSLADIPGLGK